MPVEMATQQGALLAVNGLSVAFNGAAGPRPVLSQLSFDVNPGETLAVVGESGSGKSVTALSVMRLIEYSGGAIVDGTIHFSRKAGDRVDLARQSDATMRQIRGAEISMIFQEPMTSLNPVMRVGDQIAEAVVQHEGVSWSDGRKAALRMLELARIPAAQQVLDRYPHELSGGARQRVMIGMALSCRPQLLIADEPTTALDATVQAQILRLIRTLQEEIGTAVMFITHDMGVVAQIADRMVVVQNGVQVEAGTTAEIFAAARHPYTRSLLHAAPVAGAMTGRPCPTPQPPKPAPGSSPLLRLDNLTVRFDGAADLMGRVRSRVHAVEQVSLDLQHGETLSIVGESGCGKSTLGRSILGLVKPHSGRILYEGWDITEMRSQTARQARRNIQYVFQDSFAALDPRRTVGASIAEPLKIHRLETGSAIGDRVAELLRKVGLQPEHAKRFPSEFSGGQRQRICIARALAPQPKLIIADESVAALDVTIRAQIIELLIALQRETGVAYIFISHDLPIVEQISHRVAVMRAGRLMELGARQEVFDTPRHPYTRRLLAATPSLDPARRGGSPAAYDEVPPSPMRLAGDEPVIAPLVRLSESHFVTPQGLDDLALAPA
jgi:glutathione transport system ATP-binding protein